MTREQLINALAEVKKKVNKAVERKIDQILDLCRSYNTYGHNFSFDVNGDLEKEISRLLIELSDLVLAYAESAITEIAEDKDTKDILLGYVHRTRGGMTATERVDSHSTHLLYYLQTYMAIGFSLSLPISQIRKNIITYMHNPYDNPFYRGAVLTGNAPAYNPAGGLKYGKGVTADPVDGLALTAQEMVSEAYQYNVLGRYRSNPRVIGYRVHRGSGYDCPTCDELCVGIHPLTEIVLPAHPRCMCYTTPVFSEEG